LMIWWPLKIFSSTFFYQKSALSHNATMRLVPGIIHPQSNLQVNPCDLFMSLLLRNPWFS
jgi:hypothetical protein